MFFTKRLIALTPLWLAIVTGASALAESPPAPPSETPRETPSKAAQESSATTPAASRTAGFDEVDAIFTEHCVRCHNENNVKGDFRIDDREAFFDTGMVEAGDQYSTLLAVIAGPDQSMPKDAPPLNEHEVQTVRDWVLGQANWPDGRTITEKSKADSTWWSLQPLAQPSPQATIDDFVDDVLQQADLTRNPPADRRTLIRRATYDLTGLPPTSDEIDRFVADQSDDAYELLIDRLLASPHYGQRWGRHWLDVVRFGESNGFERNILINDLWPFRDYVIDSFNQDKPFDQMLTEHLAGDVIGQGDFDIEIGSAFLVAGPYDNVGNQDADQIAQIRANTIDEMIRATSEAFLGLTVGCARCHNHKFDPILQSDYYRLYATLGGTRHGSRVITTPDAKRDRDAIVAPLNDKKAELEKQKKQIDDAIQQRINSQGDQHAAKWIRPQPNRAGTTETFDPITTQYVRILCQSQDINPATGNGFRIDEFQIWTPQDKTSAPRNVALASSGAVASGPSREIKDFPGAYGPHLAIDGKSGERFISASNHLTVKLAEPTKIDRVVFSSAKDEDIPEHRKFVFVADYRIEVSDDGEMWTEVANGHDRQAANDAHRNHRLRQIETTPDDRRSLVQLNQKIRKLSRQIADVPRLPSAWVGNHVAKDAQGPFHIFIGGSPQRKGEVVLPSSLSMLADTVETYQLDDNASEADRRVRLAQWMTDDANPLTPRVIANRLWHYHFGTGIVSTPNDFGYMGGQPSHPKLLDHLANELIAAKWRLKPIHKQIMMSQTYRQSSVYSASSAQVDADSRMLWRFLPRRLSAEEIRDTMLMISGKLDTKLGGPGFRLYHYLQDNVATYVPRDSHGPETYRRAVYHQNARAARTDLMTDFDQPDCAFSAARRAETTTPLQALTTLNHQFTLDMSDFFAKRLEAETTVPRQQIERAFRIAYGRDPNQQEVIDCTELVAQHSLRALCRVILNTSELIHVR
ncbi:F5/8 type C domain protein [Planctomycetes bacterium K23_9]|uniref:F5/8 type C domain protein n=2 Tax=Stieleria marina TaxID=1930275 RepID=A0A517NME9_9BACT|nr:F5/8 type C domain protein [Planctomycetes bacterium K23_9]